MVATFRFVIASGLVFCACPAFGAATVRLGHFATPAEPVTLTYDGTLKNVDLPILVFGQTSAPFVVGAGDFSVQVRHQNADVGPGQCQGTLGDGDSLLLALSTVIANNTPVIRCDVVNLKARVPAAAAGTRAPASRVAASTIDVTLVHLTSTAGDGWLGGYPPGAAYAAPCSPAAKTKSIAFGSQDSIALAVGRYDLAFVRMCSSGTIDVPAVADALVISDGHHYTVLAVPDGSGDPKAVRLVVVTEKA
jgi:hypothetical protein